ncbi:putative myosin-2 heavy chain [Ditylenchus destructor]|uniref:Myosin-2 heavy chain n=1 Tax=Ditylenchus destructor TaxID=166010 RepID=A0AAD4N3X4_9BILA|nr:putative myosin-2 heavy chain [Ditylenchus destructor]
MTEREENAEEISHLQRRFEALQAKNTLLAQEARENERLVSEVYSLRNLLDTAQSEINKVNKANESLTGRLYNLNSKFYKVNARASELEALAESESEENAEKMSQLQRRFEALQAESTELAHRAKETERLETEVYSLTKLLDTAQSEAKQFSDENSLLQVQMTLYEEKFEESNAQKKKAEEEIATLHDRIREVNKLNEDVVERLNTSLLKCSEELATAKEELATECEKYADERSHFQLRLNALEAENTERARCSNETERLRMEVDSLKDLLDTAQNESKQLSDENASLREKMTQYKDALQATDEHYKETLKERECKVTDLEQNLKHFEQLNAQISEELTKSNLNLDQVKKSNECLTEELKAAKDKISEIETQKAQLASQIENERAQNSKENSCLKLRLRTLEAKNIEWAQDNKAIMELTLKNDILTTEFSNAQKQVKELSDGNALLRKQVMQYKDQFNTTDAQRTKLETVYKSLLDMTRKVERDLSVKREQCKHLQKQHAERVAYYRDTLEQRESRIAELDKNVKQSEHIRSCLTEELSKSNWDIQSIRTELERQRYENEQCSLVRDQQRNADQRRIRNLESKLAHAKSLIAGIAEDLNDPESTFQGEQIGPTATNSEYEARKRHSLDNDEEDQDLRDPVKKPYFSPIPPDDLSGLPTPSNSNTTLINHGENDTTLPLLQLPIPAHEDVALNDVGVNGGITAQVSECSGSVSNF